MASMVGRQASGKKIVSSSNVKGGQSAVTFVDTNYYLLNIFSSVAIVFVNKMLMTSSKFAFSTCLAALHFATCTIATRGSQKAAGASQVPTKGKSIASVSFLGMGCFWRTDL